MKLFLSKGVDVESESDAGTPLIWAAGHGQQEAVKLLLQHDAKPNTENDDGITPLLSAVAAGSLPCLDILIQVHKSNFKSKIPKSVAFTLGYYPLRCHSLVIWFLYAIFPCLVIWLVQWGFRQAHFSCY
jgi:ankyrin repeat protein